MAQPGPICACGRPAVEEIQVASEDGVLLLPVCGECGEDPIAGEELAPPAAGRRPLARMLAREDDAQPPLPLDDDAGRRRGAA